MNYFTDEATPSEEYCKFIDGSGETPLIRSFRRRGVDTHCSNVKEAEGASVVAVEEANKGNEDKVQGSLSRVIATVAGWKTITLSLATSF